MEISRFASNQADGYGREQIIPAKVGGGHGGGDSGLVDDFLRLAEGGGGEESRSSIGLSVESHLIAYAAERSRVEGRTIEMKELRKMLKKGKCD